MPPREEGSAVETDGQAFDRLPDIADLTADDHAAHLVVPSQRTVVRLESTTRGLQPDRFLTAAGATLQAALVHQQPTTGVRHCGGVVPLLPAA